MTSIAAAGGIEGADKVRVSGASITENALPSRKTGDIISYPRIKASFFAKADAKYVPTAKFSAEVSVLQLIEEVVDEVPTGRLIAKVAIPQFGDVVDVVDMIAESKDAVSSISNNWEVGLTYKVKGRLNFKIETQTYLEEVDFGEPEERTFSRSVSELIITGGSVTPEDDEQGFDKADIKAKLLERKARHEALKAKASEKKEEKANDFSDLGF